MCPSLWPGEWWGDPIGFGSIGMPPLLCSLLLSATPTKGAGRTRRGGGDGGNALIIDGKALAHALAADTRDALLAVRARLHVQRNPCL